jgi:hypothetical protein
MTTNVERSILRPRTVSAKADCPKENHGGQHPKPLAHPHVVDHVTDFPPEIAHDSVLSTIQAPRQTGVLNQIVGHEIGCIVAGSSTTGGVNGRGEQRQ